VESNIVPLFFGGDLMGRDFRFAQRAVFCIGGLPWLGLSMLAVLTLSSVLLGQTSQGSQAVVHLPTDWSHHYLLFSKPTTAEQLRRVQQDPRYWQQLSRRSEATPPEAELDGALTPELPGSNTSLSPKNHKMMRDWLVDMGTGSTVGAGQYPGQFGFDVTTDSCANDFVFFNTSLAGSSTQASIVAYNNLYHGCGGTVPSVYWAYNTGGTISTSVTLSADGSQLAFVQAQGGVATLVLLKWAASTTESATAPMSLSTTAVGSYRGCTAPCMTTFTFQATPTTDPTPTDTYSAPFYDFTPGSDTLYVGDDAGYLHQFTGVFFGGTPAETTATWPIQVGEAKLSSPVYDPTTGNVFVTLSYTGTGNGGKLSAVCAATTCAGVSNGHNSVTIGTVTSSGPLGPDTTGVCSNGSSGSGIALRLDGPIVDPVVGGGSTTGVPLFAGTFDNVYFTSSGSSPSGNLHVCGNTSGEPTLYQVGIASNTMATSGNTVLASLSTRSATCSPVTEARGRSFFQ
jgi:hypothetical protein